MLHWFPSILATFAHQLLTFYNSCYLHQYSSAKLEKKDICFIGFQYISFVKVTNGICQKMKQMKTLDRTFSLAFVFSMSPVIDLNQYPGTSLSLFSTLPVPGKDAAKLSAPVPLPHTIFPPYWNKCRVKTKGKLRGL